MLCENLVSIQRNFDFGAESYLSEVGRIEDGCLQIGLCAYKAVIIPGMDTIRGSTLKLLEEFFKEGGVIFSVGDLPTALDGAPDPMVRRRLKKLTRTISNEAGELSKALQEAVPSLVWLEPHSPSVMLHHRRREDGSETLFLSNRSRDGAAVFNICSHVAPPSRIELASNESRLLELPLIPDATSETNVPSIQLNYDDSWQMRRLHPNVLKLDRCLFRKDAAAPWSKEMFVGEVQQLLVGQDYHGSLFLQFTFCNDLPVGHAGLVRLVVEEAELFTIAVNRGQIAYEGLDYWLDPSFLPMDISASLVEGMNTVELGCKFIPPKLREPAYVTRQAGVELEPIYVSGDFAVSIIESDKCSTPDPAWPLTGLPPMRYVLADPGGFRLVPESGDFKGDWIRSGYPFYAGELAFSKHVFNDDESPCRWNLKIPPLIDCVAEVLGNGQSAGMILWEPWEIPITLLPGDNLVELRLANTLRNLLGPHHRPCTGESVGYLATSSYCEYLDSHQRDEGLVEKTEAIRDYRFIATGFC